MDAWQTGDNVLGDVVPRTLSAKVSKDALKNGTDVRGTGYLVAIGSKSARFRRKHKERILVVILIIIILILLILLIVITVFYAHNRSSVIFLCETRECLRSAANLAQSMDLTADPCDDFYQMVQMIKRPRRSGSYPKIYNVNLLTEREQFSDDVNISYACGKWSEEHPIPDSSLSNDWFSDRQSKIYREVRNSLSKNISNESLPKPVVQARQMYATCMDTDTIDKLGLQPILEILETVGLPHFPTFINTTQSFNYDTYNFRWLDTVIKIKNTLSLDILIGFDVYPDPKNGTVNKMIMGTPETTNPLPRNIEIDKRMEQIKKHERQKLRNTKSDEQFQIFESGRINDILEDEDSDDIESEVTAYYVEYITSIIKAVFDSSDGPKLTHLREDTILLNMINAATEYVKISNIFYELAEAEDNDTLSENDSEIVVPEYKVDDIQSETDRIVLLNNASTEEIWKPYLLGIFETVNVDLDFDTDNILVSHPDLKYMGLMAATVAKTSPVVLELYLWVQTIEILIVHTTTDMRLLNDIYTKKITGVEAAVPRSTHCSSGVNEMLGMAVAYDMADPNFLHDTKPKVELMLYNIKITLVDLVKHLSWMDKTTKIASTDKIMKMKTFVGFPEWLHDPEKLEEYYKNITIDPNNHLYNMIGILQVKLRNTLNTLREPKTISWASDPTEVNAFHTFQANAITVPLAMLQYPFYDLGLEALNYGSIGTVLGHEITHGFDNIGRQYDKNGNMIQWWTNETISSFENKTECFVKHYNNIYVKEVDEYVDGHKTLGENIADFGGVREAAGAYKLFAKKNGKESYLPGFEQFTHEQLFYLSFGNLWCGAQTIQSLKWDMKDEHSPSHVRLKGVLQNIPDFAKAWKCPKNTTMNPEKRCVLF